MSTEMDERVKDEIEALEAILMEDVIIENNEQGLPKTVKTVVFPSTADDTNQQYVCVTLEVTLSSDYPDSKPQVSLRNPRGLDDDIIDQIYKEAREKCGECLGQPVIFELIELVRDKLTQSNMPRCQCAVCLYGFQQGDQFSKTDCYHYFHSFCLASHLVSTERLYREEQEKLPTWQKSNKIFQPLCPVCREPITCDLETLKRAPPPLDVENAHQFEATAELRALQAQMAALYLYQQSRGGIIDLEAEENKLLVVTGDNDLDEEETTNTTNVTPPGPSIPAAQPAAPRVVHQQPRSSNSGDHHRSHRGSNRNGRRGRDKHQRSHHNR